MAEGDRRVSAPRGKHDITRARRSVVPSKWDVLPVAAEGTAPVSAIANSHPSNSDTLPGSDESSDACRKEADNSNRHLLCLDAQPNTKMGTESQEIGWYLRSASQRWRHGLRPLRRQNGRIGSPSSAGLGHLPPTKESHEGCDEIKHA
ncbi:hypothetical protein PGT21_033197 [Puccinia graminis f. sp. tritici]|uniref:Uncharacterized protein n=1 Tax=Puccinia graminis f. sp. tritici TaxID=56615 RepID=A0A5B0P9Q6_PUCGR|nr:hypothetical protein PGT21_033197 [Puccinia graminis f. sp. tritici]